MPAVFATDTIHWHILQWHALTPLRIAFMSSEITQTVFATAGLVTFGIETHSYNPRIWPYNGIGVSSSFADK